ncbi:NUDIX hydrolase [Streptomyces sp. NPDC056738]|uniref:NUDIX hydrolase n=1 Tax=Streptomyces sp. NPDC056738 TaxID=3345933 RepID=UPI0036CCD947
MQPRRIRRQEAVEVYRNAYGSLYDDAVVSPGGKPGRYLRWAWSTPGVVVVPRWADTVALVPAFRYPIGELSWEFPRGGREPGESAEEAAVRELNEETGLTAATTKRLGALYAETGLIESPIEVVEAFVEGPEFGKRSPDVMESVEEPVWFSSSELLTAFADQRVRCAITIAAAALAWPRES